MIFCPGSTNSIQGKDRKLGQNYQRIMFFHLQETQVRNYLAIKLKRNNLRHELKKYMLKRALI
jgi:hypothetical protein